MCPRFSRARGCPPGCGGHRGGPAWCDGSSAPSRFVFCAAALAAARRPRTPASRPGTTPGAVSAPGPGNWSASSPRPSTTTARWPAPIVTETKTTLQKVEDDGVTLEIEVGMEVAGKQFDAQPQCIKQGFHGELLSPDLKVKPRSPPRSSSRIARSPAESSSWSLPAATTRRSSASTTPTRVAPYILKRESVTTDSDGKTVLGQDHPRTSWRWICPGKCSTRSGTSPA